MQKIYKLFLALALCVWGGMNVNAAYAGDVLRMGRLGC